MEERMTETMKGDPNRPLHLTPEIVDSLIDRLAIGERLPLICQEVTMPTIETLYSWVKEDKEFAELYERVISFHVHRMYEEMIEIADDTSGDWIYSIGRDGSVRRKFDRESLRRAEFRISELQRYVDWLLKTGPVRLRTLGN